MHIQPPSPPLNFAGTGGHWGLRFFERVAQNLPPGLGPVERRLLRSACAAHRAIEEAFAHRGDYEIHGLADAIDALKATANDARDAEIANAFVGHLEALTIAVAATTIGDYLPEDLDLWT
jgi:hypothetical protein